MRQAFELSIDRNVINEVVGAGIYPPAGQPFPEASPYNNPKFAADKRDVAKAKQLLKEAGVEQVKFELTFGTSTTTQQIAEIIQAMAAEAGFEISLRPTEFAAMQKEAQAGNFDVNVIGWSGRVDPDGNIHAFVTCKGALNDGKYCNAEVDKLLNEARATNDEAKRKQLYDSAQAILKEELPIIYSYYQPWPFVGEEGAGLQALSGRHDPSEGRQIRLLSRPEPRARLTAGHAPFSNVGSRDLMLRYIGRRILIAIPTSSSCRYWSLPCRSSCRAIPC